MIFSLGVIGAAAGAYLAFATVPSFAPYRDRRASAPVVLSQPIQGDAQAPDLAPSADTRDDGLRVRPDFEHGTLVVELPRWAQDTGSWIAFGQRTLRHWSGSIDPGSDSERGWEDRAPRGAQRREEDDRDYAPERWSDFESDLAQRGNEAAASAADHAREAARDVEDALADL
ncbi:hypothetical protein HNO88_000800 [Novosphingobium chloroacetimidivorans]|uniref:Uncharacterized protein n=1 Tax=Novosphingobium chloroacetimidivorans TaxID=1428314 RepID=A0A7W7K8I8_9SPHN|nr:hypothetical protein [Novosphingobium chloroacetimidivorans]MBB4857493.1 hypothetical protein [Novosphingobium chloroacetimidivorans]